MVSAVMAILSLMLGFAAYILLPTAGMMLSAELRTKLGRHYFGLGQRSLKQVSIVRRLLGGYELHRIKVDDEKSQAEITLSSGLLSDDQKLTFTDPASKIKRLNSKSTALNIEGLPAAIDPEFIEMAHHTEWKDIREGIEREVNGTVRVDPYVPVPEKLRAVDPLKAMALVSSDVDPETVQTVENLTRARFEKYGPGVSAAEMASTVMGFGVGALAVFSIYYLKYETSILGTGGSAPSGDVTEVVMMVGGLVA
jgi:hypothetical protein